MPEFCERDHSDLRVLQEIVRRDLDAIQKLLVVVTDILRDNLVTLSGHDKASADWRIALLSTVDGISQRVRSMEDDLSAVASFNSEVQAFQDSLGSSLALVRENSDLIRRFVGILPDTAPVPLSRHLQEGLRHLRAINKCDPKTGEPLSGWALWYGRVAEVWYLAVAMGALFATWRLISPYLPFTGNTR